MPPFLYNRISQPFSSFPLPPPLPQIGSLPLTPAVQQMVVQRYSNPIAVLSFPPSWQMPQMMMPSYSSVPQQYVPPVSAIPALPARATTSHTLYRPCHKCMFHHHHSHTLYRPCHKCMFHHHHSHTLYRPRHKCMFHHWLLFPYRHFLLLHKHTFHHHHHSFLFLYPLSLLRSSICHHHHRRLFRCPYKLLHH